MKKLALTLTVIMGLGLASFAQEGGGLFGRGAASEQRESNTAQGGGMMNMPATQHENDGAPLGSGAALLIGFGAAYMVAKKRKQD